MALWGRLVTYADEGPVAGFEEDVTAVPSNGRLLRPRYGGIAPTLGELSIVVRRALRKAEHDNILALAKALAFTVFLSVPALALAAFGVVSLLSQPADVRRFFALHQLRVVPVAARHLAEQSLVTVTTSSHGVLAILVGGTIAAWTLTTAMTTTMWALNAAAEVRETRSFLRRRLIAVVMLVVAFVGFALSLGLLVLGPVVSGWVGQSLGFSAAFAWVWWIAQWPVLIVGLLVTAAVLYDLGVAIEAPRRRYLAVGTVVFVALSLAFSGAFAVYVSTFPSYGHTWGSLAGVIVTLTWLWLNSAAFLFGAELNNAAERDAPRRSSDPPTKAQRDGPTSGKWLQSATSAASVDEGRPVGGGPGRARA